MKDKKIEKLIKAERQRQHETIDLIASENFVSDGVLEALGSELTNKYSEGYPGKRYYPGNKYYDDIEELAKERALKLFKLNPKDWAVNVQPYSGSPANLAIYLALLGTRTNALNARTHADIMGMTLSSGGHLTHGHKVSATGQFWKSVQYSVGEDGWINYDKVGKLAKKEKPKVIVSGFTAYPRKVDFKRFGEIAKSVGAYHVADISHIAGLVAAGLHPSPFPHADVVMTTTHKTLRGPRGAVIFSSRQRSDLPSIYPERSRRIGPRSSEVGSPQIDLPSAIDRAVFPGLQGGPHNNVTAAKAVAFYEALQPGFKKYQAQIVKNAKALADELVKLGFYLVTGGTDTHLILIDLRKSDIPEIRPRKPARGAFKRSDLAKLNIDGMLAEKKLESVGIIANRNTVPGDTSPFKPSGLRLGTPAVTTRGMKEKEMREIARLIYETLCSPKSDVPNIESLPSDIGLHKILSRFR